MKALFSARKIDHAALKKSLWKQRYFKGRRDELITELSLLKQEKLDQ